MMSLLSTKRHDSRHDVEVGGVVLAPPQRVWELLTDVERWPEWGPSVRAVRCSHRRIELGSKGKVRTALGFWVPFVITELVPGSYWAWKVASIQATGHRVEPLETGSCRLTFEIPLWAAPYGLLCKVAVARLARLAKASRCLPSSRHLRA
jgi:uncharacterized protein YndB with AHSA1/START domain